MKSPPPVLGLLLWLLFPLGVAAQQIDGTKRYSWDSGTVPIAGDNNPYGLVDLDGFDSPGYPNGKFGLLLSGTTTSAEAPPQLFFTDLSTWLQNPNATPASPVPLSQTDMFVNHGSANLAPFASSLFQANFAPTVLIGPNGVPIFLPPAVTPFDSLPAGQDLALIRKLHFPRTLNGVNGTSLGTNTKKAIILIHGWNPVSDGDSYDEPDDDEQFYVLKENIRAAIQNSPGSGWQLFTYHWEKDADTGGGPLNGVSFDGSRINGTEAAEAGHRHGQHLGQLLDQESGQQLRAVHLIAHSAGSWVTRSATKYLLSARKNSLNASSVKVQVTLLDPFIPGDLGAVDGRTSDLQRVRMSEMDSFYGADLQSLYRLENYFADDIASGTAPTFSWRSNDLV